MRTEESDQQIDEQKLVKLYMALTGTSESTARSVLMYVCPQEGPNAAGVGPAADEPVSNKFVPPLEPPSPRSSVSTVLLLIGLFLGLTLAPARAAETSMSTNAFVTAPMSLLDAVNIALQRNADVLRGQKDLVVAHGVAIQTRAIVIPKVQASGSYSAVQLSDVDIIEGQGFTFGNNQNWVSQLRLVQSFYEGGRMLSSVRVARLTREQALLNYQTTIADTVLNVQLAYYDVLLAVEQITVQEASVKLLTQELTDTKRRYEAGTVPRFNVLRAEVELANAQPNLIRARNNLRIAKNNLANQLGFNIPVGTFEDIPLTLSGKLDAEPYNVELPQAVSLALERRSELAALRKARALREEDIVNAKAGYRPTLQGYFGYDLHNSMLSQDLTDENHGWIVGAELTWTIFDGLRTRGQVLQAKANYDRAGVDIDDEGRRIELQVRTTYSTLIEAREVLESQKKVLEEAAEALRLASARYDAGTGTQLDVLSAQTALTEARSTQVRALHAYDAARARFQRAVGINITSEQAKPPAER